MRIIIMLLCVLFLSGCVETSTINNDKKIVANDNVKLGLAYLEQNDMSLAKEKLLFALSEAPRSADALDAMGYFSEKTGDFAAADLYYRRALKVAPDAGGTLNNYAAFLCRQGNKEESLKLFLEASHQINYIHSAMAYQNAGLCALSIPDKKRAQEYFTKALQQNPNLDLSKSELKHLYE